MTKRIVKIVAILSIVLLVVSYLPIAMLAPHAHPAADDFGYGAPVYYALRAGLGVRGVIGAIAENIRYAYLNWQGTFGSILLFSIQPAAFAEELYVITPFVILFTILAPIFAALFTLRSSNKFSLLLIGCLLSFISVQYLPSHNDGGTVLVEWRNALSRVLARSL